VRIDDPLRLGLPSGRDPRQYLLEKPRRFSADAVSADRHCQLAHAHLNLFRVVRGYPQLVAV
jgi:hypothetical protein